MTSFYKKDQRFRYSTVRQHLFTGKVRLFHHYDFNFSFHSSLMIKAECDLRGVAFQTDDHHCLKKKVWQWSTNICQSQSMFHWKGIKRRNYDKKKLLSSFLVHFIIIQNCLEKSWASVSSFCHRRSRMQSSGGRVSWLSRTCKKTSRVATCVESFIGSLKTKR